MKITDAFKRDCQPDPVNWNNAMECRRHIDAKTESFDVGQNERGMSFDASFKKVHDRAICVLTPVRKTRDKNGKTVIAEPHTHMRKARWLEGRK